MTPQSTPADQTDQELLYVAARLMGVQTVDLLKVRRDADGSLIVILATGQKYVFNPEQIAAQIGADLESVLQELTNPPQPEPGSPAAKLVGAKQAPPASPRAKK